MAITEEEQRIKDYTNLRWSKELSEVSDRELAKKLGYTTRAIAYWNAKQKVPSESVIASLKLYFENIKLKNELDEKYRYYRY